MNTLINNKMITCQIMGGLGNQLFQIFTTIAYALEQKQNFGFIYHPTSYGITHRLTYWENLLQSLKKYTFHDGFPKEQRVIRETGFSYEPLPVLFPPLYHNDSLTLLFGYFQSPKYFEPFWDEIYEMAGFNRFKQEIRGKSVKMGLPNLKNTISMHFRIGDYKNLQDHHNILSYDYYEKSICFILKNIESVKNEKNVNVKIIIYDGLIYCISNTYSNLKSLEEMIETYYLVLKCNNNSNLFHEISSEESLVLNNWDKEKLRLNNI